MMRVPLNRGHLQLHLQILSRAPGPPHEAPLAGGQPLPLQRDSGVRAAKQQ